MNPKTFGLTLKQARLNKGMTQEQLAEIFGVTNRTISR
ncbi:helix-turn-helix domain-containing protein [Allocoprobacillus halotolerans]|uniref:Helix-turn-helix domain-containing protein n=1 Tax=Allocoprobacillus halotolerans TaxID=2944914 RepID=A0ABY5I5T0_9FIRM|nr:helix-turn-helix transcriptional regulator [Allocoprobacillus halotolerans]UTY39315.1 helix-turn-helix domain-containing protein [Allocoprobacillus halotolerans]